MKNLKSLYQIMVNFLYQHKQFSITVFKTQHQTEKRQKIDFSEMGGE